jgi:hypothetical protein
MKSIASGLALSAAAFVTFSMAHPTQAHAAGWTQYPVPGCATDIATVGDVNYVIGCIPLGDPGNYGIFASRNHGAWSAVPGNGVQIAASRDEFGQNVTVTNAVGHTFSTRVVSGLPTGFTAFGNDDYSVHIAQWNKTACANAWSCLNTTGTWAISSAPGDGVSLFPKYGVQYREDGEASWITVTSPPQPKAIAIDPLGDTPFLVDAHDQIWKFNQGDKYRSAGQFKPFVDGLAVDIAVATTSFGEDDVWVIGATDNQPYEYTVDTGAFVQKPLPSGFTARSIAAGGGVWGSPAEVLIADQDGHIWYYTH